MEHHTGFNPAEGRALRQFQERFLVTLWSAEVKATGVYDVPTKLAVIKAQHHARYEMTGRLDEKTWDYIQTHRP